MNRMDKESIAKPLSIDETGGICYLSENNAVFTQRQGALASLDANGTHYDSVTFHRAFPFTAPDEYISVLDQDGKEIGIIRDLRRLSAPMREIVENGLALRYFYPVILKILSVKEEMGHRFYTVLTDRGECRFTTEKGGAVQRISDSHVILKDVGGNRFDIPDIYKLPAADLRRLEQFL